MSWSPGGQCQAGAGVQAERVPGPGRAEELSLQQASDQQLGSCGRT